MKKICTLLITLLISFSLAIAVLANPLEDFLNKLHGLEQLAGEEDTEAAGEIIPETEIIPEITEPESSFSQTSPADEPDGSGIPKNEPVSTTGSTYGYDGIFNLDTASSEKVNLTEGEWDIDDAQLIFWGTAIQNEGTSSLAVRNSYIRGETAAQTEPLEGNPGGLLIAGNVRATLAMGNSENIYINSTIASRNWAALSTDAAKPAEEPGQKELRLYTYGSEAIAMDGGYGAYSDLFCNLYAYGSHMQGAEIGIISGTYGKVTVGTIEDGEKNPDLSVYLTQAEKGRWSDKQLPSVIEGGRNALMIHSVNLPPYWEYEGYSEEEIPLRKTEIQAHKSTFRTDPQLDQDVKYEPQKQAYIDHTKGSVILIKSTNADINLDACELIPAEDGTGYLVQTVYNNDTMFMNAVPLGENYPGIYIQMKDMTLKGKIAHEDYQRDLILVLSASTLDGSMNEYDFAHWHKVSEEEGFSEYCVDESYGTHHELKLIMENGAVWNVTEESHLSRLAIGEDCRVNGIIYVNGVEQPRASDVVYEGEVIVTPGTPKEEETTKEPETTTAAPIVEAPTTEAPTTAAPIIEAPTAPHVHSWVLVAGKGATCTDDGLNSYVCYGCGETKSEPVPATGHNWTHSGGYPATCTEEGAYGWVCTNCAATYSDPLPAMGHNWVLNNQYIATCVSDGYDEYVCTMCGLTKTENYTYATGHYWNHTLHIEPTCWDWGQDVYVCANCGLTYYDDFPPLGHDLVYAGYYDQIYHYMTCTRCGGEFPDTHYGDPCYVCGHTGPVG